MPRFARMLVDGMAKRGHQLEVWSPRSRAFDIPAPNLLKKWLGYIDQYILFPKEVRKRLKSCSGNTLFVFTDQALGPWIPLVADRPHVIHCHDFLAQRSALGEIAENHTKWTGRQYQAFIRRGYSHGRYFVSVSEKTRRDLHRLLSALPIFSEVVYNGLNSKFVPHDPVESRIQLSRKTGIDLSSGYILHVGGNDWYKNRAGVIAIYNAWRKHNVLVLPLLMVGHHPSKELMKLYLQSPFKNDIYWLSNINDEMVCFAYSGACVFIFPSLAEGFGWPIAEAMASGCPVITTNEAPMTEVGGDAAFYIPRMPPDDSSAGTWAIDGAKVLNEVIVLPACELKDQIEAAFVNARRFDPEITLDRIECIYKKILYLEG
ncbi:glycosyltransferase [Catalinimonas niigatensis]|uniref:glycosyltransferase n=1 Tax=Catalinimonas niigatensis TaxID=1397264 RepID=UPI002666FEC6|nr:glycosyltransferase [Catalinimonas niigatensis]WPP52897.1 glycosyltransferase [Catalinimonas niigatensis]